MNNKEKELLLIAQEECAEVTQAISKVFRFGFDSTFNGVSNKDRLEEETGDLLCMIQLMMDRGLISESNVRYWSSQKRIKLEKWSNVMESA